MIFHLFRQLPAFIERDCIFRVHSSSQQSLSTNPSKYEAVTYKVDSTVRVKLVGIGRRYVRPVGCTGLLFCTESQLLSAPGSHQLHHSEDSSCCSDNGPTYENIRQRDTAMLRKSKQRKVKLHIWQHLYQVRWDVLN